MRLSLRYLNLIINFLLGTAWASVLIGAVTSFLSTYHIGFLLSLISFFIGMIPGLLGVILIEYLIISFNKYEELQKQTKLLEEIAKNNS
jgi:hypothetical protein